ncbi:MAG: 3-phosphoshikimate 1-carboxyvinyltransferase [Thermodesulfobacteriota bacterium]|nr:3-phosphoshikimate 1-carboxyvinyltransferase [Thermodesulfobacteriota bacterium]
MRPIKPITELRATIHVPGSKSYTQRALIAAALARGQSLLRGPLFSEDTAHLITALNSLGAHIHAQGPDLTVAGTGGNLTIPPGPIYMGNNGTGLRLLTGVVSLGHGTFLLDGNDRMRQRPIQPLVDALQKLGVQASCRKKDGCPPVEVLADGIGGGKTTLAGGLSSQYLSSLLLAAPYAGGDVAIEVLGVLPSRPYIDMTLDVMERFGAEVSLLDDGAFLVRAPQAYRSNEYAVEGDASSATYFMAAAAICGGTVGIENVSPDSVQGDLRFIDILKTMGCRVGRSGKGLEIRGPLTCHDDLSFDLHDVPDMVPALAVVSAFRKGKTDLKNIGHLRIKESDRIAALTRELRKIGAMVEEKEDAMVIQGLATRGGDIECYHDHRIAMSFAIAGLAIEGVVIKDPDCVKKSFPDFWDKLASLG